MVNIHLINLILYQFLGIKLNSVVLFHCWPQKTLYHFALTSLDHNLFTQYVNLNDTGKLQDIVYRYLRHEEPKIGIFLDMNCQGTEDVIEQTSHLRHFNSHYHWLIHDEDSNFDRFYDTFENVSLAVDADIAYVVPKETVNRVNEDTTSFLVFDVYNNGHHLSGKLNITPNFELECNISTCYIAKYQTKLYERSLYGNRETLRDITMRISVVVTKFDLNACPENINNFLMEDKDFHIDPFSRMGFHIFQLLVDSLHTNVLYEYHDRWNDADDTGGIIGALANETVDMTSAPFFATTGRLEFLTPVSATGDFRSVCMFRTPRNSEIDVRVFLEPFSTKVWIIFGIILLTTAVMLWLAFCVEHREDKDSMQQSYMPSLLTTCLISFGSACAQGAFLIPRSIAGRMVFICLLIVTFIMYNYYTSVVVSSLLSPPPKTKLRTLRDLAESDLDVGVETSDYTYTYLNFSSSRDVKHFVKTKVSNKKNPQSIWYSANEGILKIRNKPGFVFIFESSTRYQLIEQLYKDHEICDLNEIPFRSDTKLFTHLHKNSSYKEIVRLKILRILETGVHDKHRRQWTRTNLNCLNNDLAINVGMEYAAALFLMLVCGYAVVLVLLMIEIMWRQWELRRDKN